ncbi:MAG: IS6 family transposase [Thermoplasmata archaeon]|nr:IS6 family transposase [Thermoplasmata archaeon]
MAEHSRVIVRKMTTKCRFCGSKDLSKHGKRKGIQYFICKTCGRKFSEVDTFPDMRYPKKYIVRALTYFYNGMSLKNISHTFEDIDNVQISKSTIWRWIIKYSRLGNDYVLSLKPKLSKTWIADETVIDIWGEKYWFWDIIDTDTRFLIASHLSKVRTTKDATKLFYMAKLRSKTRPTSVRTDRLHAYLKAFNKVFYSNRPERKVEHLQSQGFGSKTNINLVERFHGSLKQRTKVMRDLKSRKSARIILDGYVTHYNFFLEHEYLEGRTPADYCGIGKGINNWGDLIDKAIKEPRENPKISLDWELEFQVE